MIDYSILKEFCAVRSASGDERKMKVHVLEHVAREKSNWRCQPEIIHGDGFQDCIILIFGKPKAAIYAHMDSIGFTVRYDNHLVKIGAPHLQSGVRLVGSDSAGEIECELEVDEDRTMTCRFDREIERGTVLTFKSNWRETEEFVQCCYMDNRLGVFMALEVCKSLENGAVVFSCWEEHGGGSVPYLSKYLFENHEIRKSLVCDITWVTEGVDAGSGTVISMRDSGIPRRSFVEEIISIAKNSSVKYQLEVEGSGGSDGNELQKQPYPIDWCFIGPPEEHVHTPDEKVSKSDILDTIRLYELLMHNL
ncbi:MAG: M20/M25/M40 family metallo-hydrolase [Bacteroidota bacterium]